MELSISVDFDIDRVEREEELANAILISMISYGARRRFVDEGECQVSGYFVVMGTRVACSLAEAKAPSKGRRVARSIAW